MALRASALPGVNSFTFPCVSPRSLDPRRSLLSERYQGTFAERVAVPRWNVIPKPPELSFGQVWNMCVGSARCLRAPIKGALVLVVLLLDQLISCTSGLREDPIYSRAYGAGEPRDSVTD